MAEEPAFEAAVQHLYDAMTRLQAPPSVAAPAPGEPDWDLQLRRLGRQRLAHIGSLPADPPLASAGRPRDVHLATQVYEIGGHTALIGDTVRARADADAYVIVTNLLDQNPPPVPDVIVARLGVHPDRVTVLQGPSIADRFDQLAARLATLEPDVLFLFHHPQDPLACLIAQSELAHRIVLMHHADATPSFGLSLPGVTVVDFSPSALSRTRSLGIESVLLPLTVADPGPRPAGFLRRGRLVTASSGSAHKFTVPYEPNYVESIGLVLEATGGWHVHIGPLDDEARTAVAATLAARGVDADRFVYVRSAPSVAHALWEHACDVYLASFPIDGARTKVEVLASGTPYLHHSRRPPSGGDPFTDPEGFLVWRTRDHLATILRGLGDPSTLAAHGAHARRRYDRVYHPEVFAARLGEILTGDPVEPTADAPGALWQGMNRLEDDLEQREPASSGEQPRLFDDLDRLQIALDKASGLGAADPRTRSRGVSRTLVQHLWQRLRRP